MRNTVWSYSTFAASGGLLCKTNNFFCPPLNCLSNKKTSVCMKWQLDDGSEPCLNVRDYGRGPRHPMTPLLLKKSPRGPLYSRTVCTYYESSVCITFMFLAALGDFNFNKDRSINTHACDLKANHRTMVLDHINVYGITTNKMLFTGNIWGSV